jgi:hypothetical protein
VYRSSDQPGIISEDSESARSTRLSILLLKEEMRRVLVYFEYKASWWVERGEAERREALHALPEGLQAYVEGQAQLQRDLASNFIKKWASLRAGGTSDEDVIAAGDMESDDELDRAGAGSEEEALDEAIEEYEGVTDDEACNNQCSFFFVL